MAHRYNQKTGRVEPKPSARERTWYRWRMRNGLEEPKDQKRFETHQGILAEIKEKLFGKKKQEI
jgi:hypothetical protein